MRLVENLSSNRNIPLSQAQRATVGTGAPGVVRGFLPAFLAYAPTRSKACRPTWALEHSR
jgi:hypothetical protein